MWRTGRSAGACRPGQRAAASRSTARPGATPQHARRQDQGGRRDHARHPERELIPAGRGRHGLVSRTVHPTVPPKVEYALTPVARELHESLRQQTDWAERNRLYIAEARAAYDTEHRPEPVDA